jgi:hypothetical protein
MVFGGGHPYPLYFALPYGSLYGRILALAELRRPNQLPDERGTGEL